VLARCCCVVVVVLVMGWHYVSDLLPTGLFIVSTQITYEYGTPVKSYLQVKQKKTRRIVCPGATLTATNPTGWPGLELGPRANLSTTDPTGTDSGPEPISPTRISQELARARTRAQSQFLHHGSHRSWLGLELGSRANFSTTDPTETDSGANSGPETLCPPQIRGGLAQTFVYKFSDSVSKVTGYGLLQFWLL
jgi:hypothetical protein